MFDASAKILIVDDMMTMRKIVTKICKELGYSNLSEAVNGADAWQKISEAQVPFDLIISDWNMPQSTGLDLLKRVRGDSRTSKTPFVMVTAESEKQQIVEALQAKVSGYIVKPFTSGTLRDKLAAISQGADGPPVT